MPTVETKRGLAAPLLFLALGLAAYGSVDGSPLIWIGALGVLVGVSFLSTEEHAVPPSTAIGCAVVFLTAWMVLTNRWINSSYTVAATYHSAFLFAGFVVGRGAEPRGLAGVFKATLAFAVFLAVWAVGERMQGAPRARTLFETPATLGATLNLVILPAIVVLTYGRGRSALAVVLALLLAGLISAHSTGAWLAFACGLLVAIVNIRRAGISPPREGMTYLVAAVAGATTIMFLGPLLVDWVASFEWARNSVLGSVPGHSRESMLRADATQSGAARLWLYDLAWRSLSIPTLVTGAGYLSFFYVLDGARADIPSFEGGMSYFVHNDYLQTLLELGIPGFMAMVFLSILPLRMLWKSVELGSRNDSVALAALGAAIATMAVHALFDFPFYIPVCLLLFGLALGLLDGIVRRLGFRGGAVSVPAMPITHVRTAGIAAACTLFAWILIVPAAAEAAAGRASRLWAVGEGQRAAFWFETARRLEPRDWRYQWYAGQFWLAEAMQHRNADAARFADRAFAEGVENNPREVRNLLGRIATHRVLRGLLDAPADGATLRQWAEQAVRLAPNDATVKAERALVFREYPPGGTR